MNARSLCFFSKCVSLLSPLLLMFIYAASSPLLGENSDSNISAKIRQISVADRMPASFS